MPMQLALSAMCHCTWHAQQIALGCAGQAIGMQVSMLCCVLDLVVDAQLRTCWHCRRLQPICVQAIKLLLMYGARAHVFNKYRQLPQNLTTNGECLHIFKLLEESGDLYRQELKDAMLEARERAQEQTRQRAKLGPVTT